MGKANARPSSSFSPSPLKGGEGGKSWDAIKGHARAIGQEKLKSNKMHFQLFPWGKTNFAGKANKKAGKS